MKTPIQMLEVFVSDIIENTVLLEEIYKKSNENYETDCSINSLIRSMKKTVDNMNEYVKTHSNTTKPCKSVVVEIDLADDIFDAVLTAKKLEAVAQTYSESFFTDEDNDNPACHMSAVIFDYARELCTELKAIENKLG
ncbi:MULTISPECIES: hypothetical protein [Klebsiella pneumoniae complex]|uniref:hypothetical protein n=1 Tax=Klebsiella pneumoniae complex TaxID=3390273 RepID=UPI00143CF251|nr:MULTISPECIES: hypothetical protein [Klebsiella]MBA6167451.1 hypothetical protein [Klebsiella variicola]MBA6183122.1 hypothetical protein [Klebsiella variicola]MDN4867453.1 hypothetical protein [Klebsiella pneumoniae]MDN4905551.1 hypothetical protein [Klebsiella pneumoniae]